MAHIGHARPDVAFVVWRWWRYHSPIGKNHNRRVARRIKGKDYITLASQ
jgi:hypothetical protein